MYRMTGTYETTEKRGVNTMIFAFIFALYGIAALFEGLEEITTAFAPVVNSGSGVLAIAFIAAVFTYRRIRARQGA